MSGSLKLETESTRNTTGIHWGTGTVAAMLELKLPTRKDKTGQQNKAHHLYKRITQSEPLHDIFQNMQL